MAFLVHPNGAAPDFSKVEEVAEGGTSGMMALERTVVISSR